MSHRCPWCSDECDCGSLVDECDHDCEPIVPEGITAADIAPIEHENVDGFCPDCGAPPGVACSCPCDLCAESGLSYCACDDDDAGYPVPDEFEDDDDDQCDYSAEDVIS